jgi:nitrogen fixation NifU-like protein
MFDDLRDLYQEVILDHGRKPRNFRRLEERTAPRGATTRCAATASSSGSRWMRRGRIGDAAFQGKGCAISTASASLMTETVRGKTTEEARALGARFRDLAMTGACPDCADDEDMDRLQALSGVHEFPSRVKCATLAWHALNAALDGAEEASSE